MTAKNTRIPPLLLTFIFLLTLACGATGQATTNAIPTETGVLRATLTNGLRVIIVRNTLAPVVTTMVNYLVGSDEAPAGFPGTAHATEHMMFRGSPGLSADQLAAISAAFGGDDNADTRQAVTQYFFTTPAENLEVALRVEATRMRDLLPDESLWEKERGAIEQEVAQDLSNPEYVFYEQLLAAVFKGSPYEHSPLGTRPSFNKTTGAMLRIFHNTWYVPNNALLVIVGNVEPQKVLEQVKKVFGNIPAAQLPARPEFNFGTVKPDTLKLDTDLPYGLTAITFRFPGADSPDFAAAQILSDVLSSQRGKLYGLVPQGKALSAEFDYDTLQKSGLGYAIAEFPAGGDSTNLLNSVKEILLAEITNGVSADLVEAAKRREIISAELQKNSVQGLASAWSQAVAVEGRLILTARHNGQSKYCSLSTSNLFFEPVHYRPLPAKTVGLDKNCLLLDGTWAINPAPTNAPRARPLNDRGWAPFKVPGQWLQQGFDVPQDKPVAVAREFLVPKVWAGNRIILRFDAVPAFGEEADPHGFVALHCARSPKAAQSPPPSSMQSTSSTRSRKSCSPRRYAATLEPTSKARPLRSGGSLSNLKPTMSVNLPH